MRISIDRESLGTSVPLVIDSNDGYEWSDEACDATLCSHMRSLVPFEDLAKMSGSNAQKLELVDSAHMRAYEVLGIASNKIHWLHALGRRRFMLQVEKVSKAIQEIIRDADLVRYVETYKRGNDFLQGLVRPRINVERMREHRSVTLNGLAQLSALVSFTPDDAGLAPPVIYDRASTSTGRLKVSQGPSILTLQKECRDIIESISGGSIYEVDFVSLEPRVALSVMGIQPPRDIYEGVREKLHMSGVARPAIKQAVISALYGSSSSALAESLGGRREAQGLIREVKAYFQVDALAAKLRAEMSKSGDRLHNYYGRPLIDVRPDDPDSKLISHYVQSSAVDVVLLGFSQLMSRVETHQVTPIYVIHDAVILDVPVMAERQLQAECAAGVDLDMGHFELGLKRVSQ